ncbi:protein kilB (plasmid) [Streptomyces sp. NBC_00536]|uniref:protein kilB n=1 Tax=Streptomyces sp. NBC_00536 TaxID=2975769 RepID=UPI002E809AB8|nr:protein kilB [Streptomyces sp. NBC_00536]WUC84540.1 protein kilB [Streptomyces sp. NBC_00536]
MLSTAIAVLGTLLGAVVAGAIQHRTTRTSFIEARQEHRQDKELAAATAFAAALAGHRRAMAVREGLRLDEAAPEVLAAARAESHATRSAIEAPKVTVSILMPSLTAAAEEAARAAVALREAPDHESLDALRERAIAAADRFVTAAALHFSTEGS